MMKKEPSFKVEQLSKSLDKRPLQPYLNTISELIKPETNTNNEKT